MKIVGKNKGNSVFTVALFLYSAKKMYSSVAVRLVRLLKQLSFAALSILVIFSSVTSLIFLNLNTPMANAQTAPAGTWDQVSAGGDHACAIADGEVYCWGANGSGQLGDGTTTQRATPVKVTQEQDILVEKTVTQVSAGASHTCAVADGEVYCWGRNGDGQLGDGTTAQRLAPVKVNQEEGLLAGKTVTYVSTGSYHACAVANGNAYCWGRNGFGQLGDGTSIQRAAPVAVTKTEGFLEGKAVTQVAVGADHSCVLANSETYCWGLNNNGQLGDGTTITRATPIKVSQIEGLLLGRFVTQISSGSNSTCVVANSEAYCWGGNSGGRLGDGTTTQRTLPVKVTQQEGLLAGKNVTQISINSSHTCAIADGDAFCWGYNWRGGLGDGTGLDSTVPVEIMRPQGMLADKHIEQISVSGYFTCSIGGGEIYCWGENYDDQIGYESNDMVYTPTKLDSVAREIFTDKSITHISSGDSHTCVIADGEAYCWGNNYNGQLGNGQTTNITNVTPVKVLQEPGLLEGKTVTSIAAGSSHTCAVADGEAFCWGNNWYGQLGDGTTIQNSKPIKVMQSEGLLAGKIITQITTGSDYTCAIAVSEAYCWGSNWSGGLGDGTIIDKNIPVKVVQVEGILAGKAVTQIAVRSGHTCAIANNETYCWGRNNYGQLGDNSIIQRNEPVKVTQVIGGLAGKNVARVSVGFTHTCVIADSETYCWGNGGSGELGDGLFANSQTPVKVSQVEGFLADRTVTQLTNGDYHSCVVADGEIYCWGGNWYGQIAQESSVDESALPLSVISTESLLAGKSISAMSAGELHTCVVADGEIYCWGANFDGQLGTNPYREFMSPIQLPYILPSAYLNTTNRITTTPSTTPVAISSRPTFTGSAQPNSTVLVTVYSDPVTCTTTANESGYWECTLTTDLPDGEHTVYVEVTTPTGDITTFGPYSVQVTSGTALIPGIPNTGQLLTTFTSPLSLIIATILTTTTAFVTLRHHKQRNRTTYT